MTFVSDGDITLVSRAFVNSRARQIGGELGAFRIQQIKDIRVVPVSRIIVQPTGNPRIKFRSGVAGFCQQIIVVIRIHEMSQLQLLEVVHA